MERIISEILDEMSELLSVEQQKYGFAISTDREERLFVDTKMK